MRWKLIVFFSIPLLFSCDGFNGFNPYSINANCSEELLGRYFIELCEEKSRIEGQALVSCHVNSEKACRDGIAARKALFDGFSSAKNFDRAFVHLAHISYNYAQMNNIVQYRKYKKKFLNFLPKIHPLSHFDKEELVESFLLIHLSEKKININHYDDTYICIAHHLYLKNKLSNFKLFKTIYNDDIKENIIHSECKNFEWSIY